MPTGREESSFSQIHQLTVKAEDEFKKTRASLVSSAKTIFSLRERASLIAQAGIGDSVRSDMIDSLIRDMLRLQIPEYVTWDEASS